MQPQSVEARIGAMIRLRREELKLPQSVIADRIGILPQQLQRHERGESRLDVPRLIEIATALGVDISYFVPPAATMNGGPDVAVIDDSLRLLRALGRISRRDIRAALVTLAESQSSESVAVDGMLLASRPANGAPPSPPHPPNPGEAEAASSCGASHG
jgi:transcriptional regulator with XRE-family HTH domain